MELQLSNTASSPAYKHGSLIALCLELKVRQKVGWIISPFVYIVLKYFCLLKDAILENMIPMPFSMHGKASLSSI